MSENMSGRYVEPEEVVEYRTEKTMDLRFAGGKLQQRVVNMKIVDYIISEKANEWLDVESP